MFCWSLVDLRVHACEPDLFSMWPKVLSPWHWHYALGPDGVTSRDFLEEWYLFTLLLLHKRDDLSADPFNFEPKPMRDVGRENCLPSRPCCGIPAKTPIRHQADLPIKCNKRNGRRGIGYKRLPGTRMKRQQSAASTSAIHARHMSARLLRSFLSRESVRIPREAKRHSDHTLQRAP